MSDRFFVASDVAHTTTERVYLVRVLLFVFILLFSFLFLWLFFLFKFLRKVRPVFLPKFMSILRLLDHLSPVLLLSCSNSMTLTFELKRIVQMAEAKVLEEKRDTEVF
jgi:hypothetical protein